MVYILFSRFTEATDMLNYIRKTVKNIFPDWEELVDLDKLAKLDQQCLLLLDIEGDLTDKEVQTIRKAYLENLY